MLPYNLGSTDNQHHFSDANDKVTLTLKILQYNETDHFTACRTYSTILLQTRETWGDMEVMIAGLFKGLISCDLIATRLKIAAFYIIQ